MHNMLTNYNFNLKNTKASIIINFCYRDDIFPWTAFAFCYHIFAQYYAIIPRKHTNRIPDIHLRTN